MKEDFAEFTQCPECEQPLINCNCMCPYCGSREECDCELESLSVAP